MKLRENPAVKALAFIAAVAAFAATAIMGWYQLVNYDALWNPDYNAADGYTIYHLEQSDEARIHELANYSEMERYGAELSLYQERQLAQLEEELSAQGTNLRWQIRDQDRQILWGNTQEELPARGLGLYWTYYTPLSAGFDGETVTDEVWERAAQHAVNVTDPSNAIYSDDWRALLEESYQRHTGQSQAAGESPLSQELAGVDENTVFLAADGTCPLLWVEGMDGAYLYGPSLAAMLEPNQFGYQFVDGAWEKVVAPDNLDLVMWLDGNFPVDDQYRQAYLSLNQWKGDRGVLLGGTVACGVLGIVLAGYLCAACGHRPGRTEIYLNWFHRLPGDLLLFLLVCGVAIAMSMAWEVTLFYAYADLSMAGQLVLIGLLAAACSAMGMAGLLTVVVRGKAHTLMRNTLIYRLARWLGGLCSAAARALPLAWKTLLAGMGYVLFTILTFQSYAGVWLLGSGIVVAALCAWAAQWHRIRAGAQEIIRGNPEEQIDTRGLFPDLKGHADELNNLGQAISAAVEDRMRSEHFKAELITNVSHDLKTPLTSIINYVDLLKKERIDNPQAEQFIEVLDRKSQRLKKLTEDLVEASKASTGNLTVTLERLDLVQLLDQAVAEYLDRLEGKGLSVVRSLPGHPVWVQADGRHLWRVLDNLLSNCAKYALEGTRIYLGVEEYTDSACFSLKNISREELNVPTERLMERFVRGDAARTAEGSGLGLSIAQSLTELQQGRFAITIDGDLFKASVTLPRAPAPQGEQAP